MYTYTGDRFAVNSPLTHVHATHPQFHPMLRRRRGSLSSIARRAASLESTCTTSALLRLNSETIGDIVHWINYDDVVRLKSVGNDRLTRLLSQPRVITRLSLIDLPSDKALRGGIRSVYDYLLAHPNAPVKQIFISSKQVKTGYSIGEFTCILPLHLTHLTLHFRFIITQWTLAQLPRSLVWLDLAATDAHLTDDCLRALPPNLTHLGLMRFSDDHSGYGGRAVLTNQCASLLPPNLVYLSLYYAHFLTDDALRGLPRSIAYLSMGCCQRFTDVGISYLPRGLTCLGLCCSPSLTDACVRLLPPKLEDLYLGDSENITDECIFDLPRTLTRLELTNASLSDACVPDLPRGLIDLDIGGSSALSDLCIPDLPRSLESLNLHRAYKLTDACIRHLPRTLTKLVASNAHRLTTACIPDLPPCLKRLDVKHNAALNAYFAKHKPDMLPASSIVHRSSATCDCIWILIWLLGPLAVMALVGMLALIARFIFP